MSKDELLVSAKNAVLQLEPGARVVLYGSRARGDATSDSDWDFLVLLDGQVDNSRVGRIRTRLYDIELESDQIISSVILDEQEWEHTPFNASPFHERVSAKGVTL